MLGFNEKQKKRRRTDHLQVDHAYHLGSRLSHENPYLEEATI